VDIEPSQPSPSHDGRRRDIRLPAHDVLADGVRLEGQLLNVARSGLAVETSSSVRLGQEYRLRLRFEDVSFWVSGTVRWCILRRTHRNGYGDVAPVYHAGLSLQDSQRAAHKKLLDTLANRLLEPAPR